MTGPWTLLSSDCFWVRCDDCPGRVIAPGRAEQDCSCVCHRARAGDAA